ncbi:hypothetical protein TRFO_32864 [Tritrichomonas foetus]|uniref:AAA+ ATPase domain-containing protein n=1 Tax=Tritrichomonas foetus TaxID=1144522 RepID=A0A1J4JMV9_9EUKA|nr:hypothetical protein TRFO_32864 [Tritrichomonas foetus]|eukprot:OHT00457.1 hypothetical protein TRFO_32864 [Tritrichomonas foetus]
MGDLFKQKRDIIRSILLEEEFKNKLLAQKAADFILNINRNLEHHREIINSINIEQFYNLNLIRTNAFYHEAFLILISEEMNTSDLLEFFRMPKVYLSSLITSNDILNCNLNVFIQKYLSFIRKKIKDPIEKYYFLSNQKILENDWRVYLESNFEEKDKLLTSNFGNIIKIINEYEIVYSLKTVSDIFVNHLDYFCETDDSKLIQNSFSKMIFPMKLMDEMKNIQVSNQSFFDFCQNTKVEDAIFIQEYPIQLVKLAGGCPIFFAKGLEMLFKDFSEWISDPSQMNISVDPISLIVKVISDDKLINDLLSDVYLKVSLSEKDEALKDFLHISTIIKYSESKLNNGLSGYFSYGIGQYIIAFNNGIYADESKFLNLFKNFLNHKNSINSIINGFTNNENQHFYIADIKIAYYTQMFSLAWRISHKNRIWLAMNYDFDNIVFIYSAINLASLKLNMSIEDNSQNSKSLEKKFVKFYQRCEELLAEIDILYKYNYFNDETDENSELILTYFSVDDIKTIKKDIQKYRSIRELIEKSLSLHNKLDFNTAQSSNDRDSLSFLSKDHLCQLFFSTKEIFNSIMETINTPDIQYPNNEDNFHTFLNRCEKIFNSINITQSFNDVIPEFESIMWELSDNTKKLFESINKSLINPIEITPKANNDQNTLLQKLTGLTILLLINPPDYIVPMPNQFLMCSLEVSTTRIKIFFDYFIYVNNHRENCHNPIKFVLIDPQHLSHENYQLLQERMKHISYLPTRSARLVILTTTSSVLHKSNNEDIIQTFHNLFKEYYITKFSEYCEYGGFAKSLFFRANEYHEFNPLRIPSYFIYTQQPRTGKTQFIMKYIFNNYDKHTYHKILIEANISLSDLIDKLNYTLHVHCGEEYKRCIHFSIEGEINSTFCFYIMQLLLFHNLNDGTSLPFIVKPNMVFFFEFGANKHYNKENFMKKLFPIGQFMMDLQIDTISNADLFSLSEYVVRTNVDCSVDASAGISHSEIHKLDIQNNRISGNAMRNIIANMDAQTKIKKISNFDGTRGFRRKQSLIDAAAIIKIYNSNFATEKDIGDFVKSADETRFSILKEDFYRYIDELVRNPKEIFYTIAELISKPNLIFSIYETKIFPNNYVFPDKNHVPISQVCDVACFISRHKYTFLRFNKLNRVKALPLLLNSLFYTALINCGIPLSLNNQFTENRLEIIEKIHDNPKIITLLTSHPDENYNFYTSFIGQKNKSEAFQPQIIKEQKIFNVINEIDEPKLLERLLTVFPFSQTYDQLLKQTMKYKWLNSAEKDYSEEYITNFILKKHMNEKSKYSTKEDFIKEKINNDQLQLLDVDKIKKSLKKKFSKIFKNDEKYSYYKKHYIKKANRHIKKFIDELFKSAKVYSDSIDTLSQLMINNLNAFINNITNYVDEIYNILKPGSNNEADLYSSIETLLKEIVKKLIHLIKHRKNKICTKEVNFKKVLEYCNDWVMYSNFDELQNVMDDMKDENFKDKYNFNTVYNCIYRKVVNESMIPGYSITTHNINRLLHIKYRIDSNLPIILMGETGTGKTYTINFISQLLSSEDKAMNSGSSKIFSLTCDGGTTSRIIFDFVT